VAIHVDLRIFYVCESFWK